MLVEPRFALGETREGHPDTRIPVVELVETTFRSCRVPVVEPIETGIRTCR